MFRFRNGKDEEDDGDDPEKKKMLEKLSGKFLFSNYLYEKKNNKKNYLLTVLGPSYCFGNLSPTILAASSIDLSPRQYFAYNSKVCFVLFK